jgi:hypothetical protein
MICSPGFDSIKEDSRVSEIAHIQHSTSESPDIRRTQSDLKSVVSTKSKTALKNQVKKLD